jgi:hypothetical protein
MRRALARAEARDDDPIGTVEERHA